MDPQRNISRRDALKLMGLIGACALAPQVARGDTQQELDSAQGRLAAAQAELEQIAAEYEELSKAQAKTLDELEDVTGQIKRVSAQITQLEAKLRIKQEDLAAKVANEYKDGNHGVVDLFLGATSVEDLMSSLYYYDKVTEEQARLIEDVKQTQSDLAQQRVKLEGQQHELEAVKAAQAEQLEAMRAKQEEAQELIEGLDKEVRDLIAKRDAEILAAQQEAEKARKEREKAAAAAKQAERAESETKPQTDTQPEQTKADEKPEEQDDTWSEESPAAVQDTTPEVKDEPAASGSAAAVVAACHSTPSPGAGLCAAWCSNVMMNAGFGFISGNANDMYAEYCFSSDRSALKPGMAVAVSTHPHTTAGRIYGHIGMYVGNGTVMDNIGYIRTISVDEWISFYGATVPVRWGWLGGIALS